MAMAKAVRSKPRRKGSLGKLDVEQFMALSSSEEEVEPIRETKASRKRKRSPQHPKMLPTNFSDQDEELLASELLELCSAEEEEGLGVVEPRPPEVTSWKQEALSSSEEEEGDSMSEGGEEEGGEEGESEQEQHQQKKEELSGKFVTLRMVREWVKTLEKSHSLHSLRLLSGALHAAILTTLQHDLDTPTPYHFVVQDSAVFNALVTSCFQQVPTCLHHHFPHTSSSSTPTKPRLPSSQTSWSKIRRTVKQYLFDLLSLAGALQDADMQHAVLKQVHSMAAYFASLPKLLKPLNKYLLEKWSNGEGRVQVLAFLALRKVLLYQAHPALHTLLKKAYMAFVRNCKFTSASSLPGIKFMISSLVELLAIDPPTTYHHAFVYIRQLAVHLRTALTSGKKDAQQSVYNWQFLHCLSLWTQVLSQVSHASLRPLIYPLVQVSLGTLNVQPSAKYYPIRLHLVRLLLQLSAATSTYIPIATYLVEVMEDYGVEVKGVRLQSGKPPELHTLLRATKQHLNTRSFRTAVVNEAFLLMLQYFSEHAHYISFPELVYPTLVRLRKVSKNTPYSWLRMQLKQMIEKVEEVSKDVAKERAVVTFSPVQQDLVASWESQRKGKESSLSQFWTRFSQLHTAQGGRGKEAKEVGASEEVESAEASPVEGSEEEEDVVEDLQLDD